MKNPFIIGDKIYLRGLEKEDINGNNYQWFNDQEVCAGNSHAYKPNNFPNMENYLNEVYNSNSLIVFAIIDKTEDKHIGNISLQDIDWLSRTAEYAIIIGEKEFWGKGYSKEASELILHHGFVNLNLHRIYLGTFENNIGMQKLSEKLRMTKEGVRRKAIYKNGKYLDIIEYGILREEYFLEKK